MNNKKKIISFCAACLSLTLLVGTWAFYSATSTIDNKLKTNNYGNRTVEEFTPNQEIEPGVEIIKAAGVTNTGDYKLAVRIKMTEKWERGGTAFISHDSKADTFLSVEKEGDAYTAKQYGFDGSDSGAIDGKVKEGTNADESVMYKNMDASKWIDGGDGYWYYKDLLGVGQNTGDLLQSLILADNADMGKYNTATYYSIVAKDNTALLAAQTAYDTAAAAYESSPTDGNKAAMDTALAALNTAYGWTTTKPANESTITFIKAEDEIGSNGGYANADYTLSIITEVCQATEEAVKATWTTDPLPAAVELAWGW